MARYVNVCEGAWASTAGSLGDEALGVPPPVFIDRDHLTIPMTRNVCCLLPPEDNPFLEKHLWASKCGCDNGQDPVDSHLLVGDVSCTDCL